MSKKFGKLSKVLSRKDKIPPPTSKEAAEKRRKELEYLKKKKLHGGYTSWDDEPAE